MKTVERYRSYGFNYSGYILESLSSKELFPDYIREETQSAIERIKSHQKEGSTGFVFMADQHYLPSENHDIRLQRTLNAYRLIAEKCGIDTLVLGGDYTIDGDKDHKAFFFRELCKILHGKWDLPGGPNQQSAVGLSEAAEAVVYHRDTPYLPVHGNHDDGTIWDKVMVPNEKTVNYLTHEELYTLFYDHLPDLGAVMGEEPGALYYYYDDKASRTRYICLDSGDIPYFYEDGKLKYLGQDCFAMSQKQVDWLVHKALCFEESDYGVVFVIHSLPNADISEKAVVSQKELAFLTELIDCYKKGENLNCHYNDGDFALHVEADFEHMVRGDVVGVFMGHYHADRIGYTPAGVPLIATGCAGMHSNPDNIRRDGDKSELLFDVVTVDRKEKKIYITRVGCGEDRVVRY